MNIESPLWIYWGCCVVPAALLLRYWPSVRVFLLGEGGSRENRQGYGVWLGIGWLATLMTAVAYVMFTQKYVNGPYDLPSLVTASVLNGVLEQFMFVFWFLLGAYLCTRLFPKRSRLVFAVGYLSYAVYSGFIHALFWTQVLPAHEPFLLAAFLFLPLMSGAWMWLLWRYQAIASIAIMHISIDFLTLGHLHFPWFEPFQWSALTRSHIAMLSHFAQ